MLATEKNDGTCKGLGLFIMMAWCVQVCLLRDMR